LLRASKDQTLVEAVSSGSKPEGLSARDQAMLAHAEKLTSAPHAISQADIEALRSHGFNDRAVLEINLAAAYMNFVNRVASGLGVELEDALKAFTR
jgi:uncharacterized peroxidase-related enzyme